MCKNKIIKLEIKYASVPVKLELRMLFLSTVVGKEKTMMPSQQHICGALEMFEWLSWLVFKLVVLARLMLQQGKHFLTLQHVLLGNGQGQQPDVPDEGAPGLGSGERRLGWQRVVGLDHQVNSQQHQAQGEQSLQGKTGTGLMTLQGAEVSSHQDTPLAGIKGLWLCTTTQTLLFLLCLLVQLQCYLCTQSCQPVLLLGLSTDEIKQPSNPSHTTALFMYFSTANNPAWDQSGLSTDSSFSSLPNQIKACTPAMPLTQGKPRGFCKHPSSLETLWQSWHQLPPPYQNPK